MSVRGSERRFGRGFTLIELLVVLVLVAIGAGIVSLALRDGAATRLEEEGARLAALLEGARAEARAAGVPVYWVPKSAEVSAMAPGGGGSDDAATADDNAFRFVGLPVSVAMPRHWLEPRVTAQVVGGGGKGLVLGPDAVIPAQRVVLSLEDRRLEVATDGLAPFAITPAADAVAEAAP
ncbi:MAG: prepilin-type N-terminal cleavage/methylation domain-containing protein [Betaproteobacteria bacterium]|jgi:general secretion pathway protein H|nr:prepilin-type N-terminal cleavage/methylation domain-containing protein [Betaproteobacteria bacterium]MCC6851857.1 prepilin-type N-terminal cleavage/methylation domain-containing protein [Rubrivivax sp.]